MKSHKPYAVARPFWTPGTLVMLVLMVGAGVTLFFGTPTDWGP